MASKQTELRVVIFSGGDVSYISRLIHRIHAEVPEARVCGVLTERRISRTLHGQTSEFVMFEIRRADFT